MMVTRHAPALPQRRYARVMHECCPSKTRAQGRPGARCTRGPCAENGSTRKSPQVKSDQTGLPCAMVLTAYSALLVTGLSCHRRPCDVQHHHELDASVGASGPHGFAVRIDGLRPARRRVHCIPHPTSVTTRTPLSSRRDVRDIEVILAERKAKCFSEGGWTGDEPDSLSGKSVANAAHGPHRRGDLIFTPAQNIRFPHTRRRPRTPRCRLPDHIA